MINKEEIGEKLKHLRLSRDLKQFEVAEKVGLSRATISNIEKGRRSLTLKTLKKFCELYHIDISYFGIETHNFDEAVDLTTRFENIFNSDAVPVEKKDELYMEIMRIYLESKK